MAMYHGQLGHNMVVLYILCYSLVLLDSARGFDDGSSDWYIGCHTSITLPYPDGSQATHTLAPVTASSQAPLGMDELTDLAKTPDYPTASSDSPALKQTGGVLSVEESAFSGDGEELYFVVSASEADHDPVLCASTCSSLSYHYLSIDAQRGCVCLKHQPAVGAAHDSPAICDHRCGLKSLMPCGGDGVSSIYRSDGPYLSSIMYSMRDQGRPYQGQKVAIEVRVHFAGLYNMTLGQGLPDVDTSYVAITWSTGSSNHSVSQVASSNKVQDAWITSFIEPGLYEIEVSADNGLSTVSTTVQMEVIPGRPDSATLALLTSSPLDQPSCSVVRQRLCERYGRDAQLCAALRNDPVLQSFTNATRQLRASLKRGYNVTFSWLIEKVLTDGGREDVWETRSRCPVLGCHQDVQEFAFDNAGLHEVHVQFKSPHGALNSNMFILAEDRQLSDLHVLVSSNLTSLASDVTTTVTVVTNHPYIYRVQLNYGDGKSETRWLRSHHEGGCGNDDYSDDNVTVGIVPADSCNLSFMLYHSFSGEGRFVINAAIIDCKDEVLLSSSSRSVTVQRQLHQASLGCPQVASSEDPFNLTLFLSSTSLYAEYAWNVTSQEDGRSLPVTCSSASCVLDALTPGLYHVQASAVNLVSHVTANASFIVEEPVDRPNLSLIHAIPAAELGQVMELGQIITLQAEVTSGSNVEFLWFLDDDELADEQVTQNSTHSSVTHAFSAPGSYNVSVQANNSYNTQTAYLERAIAVQEAVSGLMIDSDTPVLRRKNFSLKASIGAGSDVVYNVSFGDGGSFTSPGKNVSANHRFQVAGLYNTTVTAYNNISQVTQTLAVLVLDSVKNVKLKTYPEKPVPNEITVLVALADTANEELSQQHGVVYNWSVNGEVKGQSALPVFDHKFLEAGSHNVTVHIFNLVSTKVLTRTVEVEVSTILTRFNLSSVSVVGQHTDMTIFLIPGAKSVTVDYGNGNESYTVNGSHGQDIQVSRQYNRSGIYFLSATCKSDTGHVIRKKSVITAQHPISQLSITGPRAIAKHQMGLYHTWRAQHDRGTHVIYNWTLSQQAESPLVTTKNMVVHRLPSVGHHTITLHAFNRVSQRSAAVDVLIREAISMLSVHADSTIQNHTSLVNITLRAGLPVLINISFGDSNFKQFLTNETSALGVTMKRNSDDEPWVITVPHVYALSGRFTLNVSASNVVSEKSSTITTVIDEPITGLELRSSPPFNLRTDQVATVTASVATGKNLQFRWFADGANITVVDESPKMKTACIMFTEPGNYSVTVSITNPIHIKLNMTISATLDQRIAVYSPLTGVTLSSQPREYAALHGNSTGDIAFTARSQGGTIVQFVFDFGDDTNLSTVTGQSDGAHDNVATVTHRYHRARTYNVSVTASTPVDSVPGAILFVIQIPPSLASVKAPKIAEYGKEANFTAILRSGTDLLFDWYMGDGVRYITGARVRHTYNKFGRFLVNVTALNRVSRHSVTANVTVLAHIEYVDVRVSQSAVHLFKSQIALTATVKYPSNVDWYRFEYDIGGHRCDEDSPNSVSFCTYSVPGRYVAHVTAFNDLGNKTSDPVYITSVVPFTEVTMTLPEEAVTAQPLRFTANVFSGNEMLYVWDFGDGTINETTSKEIWHTYSREGAYTVRLNASNPFDRTTVAKLIFVLHQPCKAPEVEMLGNSEQPRLFERSVEVKVEARVAINCSITSSTVYEWRVYNKTSGVIVTGLDEQLLHDPVLVLPRRVLHYGSYTVQLIVNMTGTIVFSGGKSEFDIVPSPLMAIIQGGAMRQRSRSENTIMDASLSYDPDVPSINDMSYLWGCYPLINRTEPCFNNGGFELKLNESLLSIPGRAFNPNLNFFVFNLTVWRPGRNASSVTQVLKLLSQDVMDVSMECEMCEGAVINADQRLILKAVLPGNSHHGNQDHLQYTWRLYKVVESTPYLFADIHKRCVSADGEVYRQVLGNLSDTENITTEAPTPSTTTVTTTTSTTTPDPGGPLGGILEESSSEGGRELGGGLDGLQFQEHETSSERGGFGDGFPDLSEASSENDRDNVDNSNSEEVDDGNEADGVVAEESTSRPEPHIMSRVRNELPLREHDTTSGLGREILAIREGVLEQGLTYIVEVTATDQETNRSGKALTHFHVNESPFQGYCRITPSGANGPGLEMDTLYRIFCQEWRDEETPLRYEVGYTLSDKLPAEIVYLGLDNDIHFRLPAGLPEHDHSLLLHIAILDNLGARTEVCATTVTVLPRSGPANRTHEEILYSLVERNHSELAKLLDEGDNRNARLHTRMVASRLNRLPPTPTDAHAQHLRREIRFSMLGALSKMPLRDQFEIHQTTTAMSASTSVVEELSSSSLRVAAEIITNATQQINSIAVVTEGLSSQETEDLALISIEGTSNILRAVGAHKSILEKQDTKYIVHKAQKAVQNILKAELKKRVVGDNPVNRSTSILTAYANTYQAATPAVIHSPAAVFSLPDNILSAPRLKKQPKLLEEDATSNVTAAAAGVVDLSCYQTMLVTYKDNPFVYGHDDSTEVESQVATLTLHSCSGEELKVSDLSDDQHISITIPRHTSKALPFENLNHTLTKSKMNVHEFDINQNASHRTLHIHILLHAVPDNARLFPIAVLLRFGQHPTPTEYRHKWEIAASQSEVSIDLPPQLHNVSQRYFLAVVDARFNAGQPREGEAKKRGYTIKLWQGECVFWDELLEAWSDHGCEMDNKKSSFDQAHCSCNHLTSFGAQFSLAPNELNLINVEDFFSLSENPVTVSFIGALLLLYAILLIPAIHLDRHDAAKSRPVHLVDNNSSDQQKYLITIETGFRKGASTTAKVSLVLHGEEGMSETRELVSKTRKHSLFERHSRDVFFITLPQSLGRLQKVQIWHNNAGCSPSWYLSRVIVQDLNRTETYYFICEKWFAAEEDDGKVEREIHITEGGLGFKKVLWAKGAQFFADYHLWFSTFSRPSYSRFTRAQRLTCCLSLLMSYLAVNCMWYNNTGQEYRGEFRLIDVSWQSVIVGILTSLIVLPPNFIIILLFRQSKVSGKSPVDEDINQKAVKSESISTVESTTRLLQPAVSPSIFDQSIHHWQNLQEWAQKIWAKHHPESENHDIGGVKPNPVTQQQRVIKEENREGQVLGAPSRNEGQKKEAEEADKEDGEDVTVVTRDEGDKVEEAESAKVEEAVEGQTAVRNVTEAVCDKDGDNKDRVERKGSHIRACSRHHNKPQHIKTASHSSGHSSGSNDSHTSEGSMIQPPSRYTLIPPTPPSSIFNTPPRSPSSAHPGQGHVGGISRSQRGSEKSRSTYSDDCKDGCSGRGSGEVHPPCSLPYGFVYVAWMLAVLVICGCGAVTVMYGLSFGAAKSIRWLQSLFFSAIQCVFITHPILIILYTVYTAKRYQNDMRIFYPHDNGLLDNIAEQCKNSEEEKTKKNDEAEEVDMEKGIAARQRSRYLRFARPPQEKELITSRTLTLKQKQATALFNEAMLFGAQFVLILIVAFGRHSDTAYHINNTLTNTLARSGQPSFTELKSVPGWWTWLRQDFLHQIDADPWYTDQPPIWPWVTVENSVVIGQIHLRQHRVKPHPCDLPDLYSLRDLCRSSYSVQHKETESYGPNETYWYSPSYITGAASITGNHGNYDSSGYIVVLSNNKSQAAEEIDDLEENGWIDVNTRAVIIEFTLFHPPTNLFSTMRLLLEMPPTGSIFTSHQVVTATLYKYVTSVDKLVLAAELFFIMVTMVKLHLETKQLVVQGKNYFKSPWNLIEACQCSLSIVFMACYVYRFFLVGHIVESLRASYMEKFFDVGDVYVWDQTLRVLVAWIVLLVTVQLLKVLQHRQPFARFAVVYQRATTDILVFALVYLIWTAAYVSVFMALYGAMCYDFSRLDLSITTVTGLFTGYYSLQQLEAGDQWTALSWRLVFSSFIIFAMTSLTAYIIAILNFHYKLFKDETQSMFSSTELLKYYWEKLLQKLGLVAMATDDEDDTDHTLPPEYTMAEIEYQVDEMLFKMNSLAGTCNLPAKPPDYYTDSDTTYGGAAEDILSTGGSDHFNEKLEHRVHKIEDSLFTQEPQLAQLLQLNNCGVHPLAQQTEKQLRSHLEFVTFHQLQLQRQGPDKAGGGRYPSGASSDMYASSLSTSHTLPSGGSTAYQGSSSSGTVSSDQPSETQDSRENSPPPKSPQPAKNDEITLVIQPEITGDDGVHQSGVLSVDKGTKKTNQQPPLISPSDALVLQDVADLTSSSCSGDDGIQLSEIINQTTDYMSSGFSEGTKTGVESTATSLTGDKHREEYISLKPKKKDLKKLCPPPNSPAVIYVHKLKDNDSKTCTSRGQDDSATLKPKIKSDTPIQSPATHRTPSSSSSDEDISPPKVNTQPGKTLRKTRSRGKGKGEVSDAFAAFDNRGYSSDNGDSERRASKSVRKLSRSHPRETKQCWS